jgi:hypothetical protein
MKLLFKGGVHDPRKTGSAFCGAADRAMEPLEGGAIGRAFGKPHNSIHGFLSQHGGIVPPVRRRSLLVLTAVERANWPNFRGIPLDYVGGYDVFSFVNFEPRLSISRWSM